MFNIIKRKTKIRKSLTFEETYEILETFFSENEIEDIIDNIFHGIPFLCNKGIIYVSENNG